MKSPNQHIDQKIRQKITEHEFEFSDHAWNQMEGILDPPSSSRKPYFFIFLSFVTMMVFLYLLYAMMSATGLEDATATTDKIDNQIIVKNEIAVPKNGNDVSNGTDATKPTSSVSTGFSKNGKSAQSDFVMVLNAPSNNRRDVIFEQLPYLPLTNSVQPRSVTQPIPFNINLSSDVPAFVQELQEALSEHEAHFATEKVYVHMDRTWFKPGETVWFNAYLRDANTLQESRKSDIVHVWLEGPNGKKIYTHKIVAQDGTGAGQFKLPKTAKGGEYTVRAFTNWQKNQELAFVKKIQVNKSVIPKLNMQLDMDREAYGPGDEVSANLELRDKNNQLLVKKQMAYAVQIGGKSIYTKKVKTNKDGKVKLKFDLPDDLATTDGLVNVVIEHQGQFESIARSIPIVLNKIDLQFLPEGGYLLSGKNNGLGFKAINEFGKPADISGVIVNGKGEEVAAFSTYHMGMGAMDFQPEQGEAYTAKIIQPVGILETYPLPEVQERGYGIKVVQNAKDSLLVDVTTTEDEALTLIVQSRGKIHGYAMTAPEAGTNRLAFDLKNIPIGVAQLTLFDGNEIPRAERMVFLNPDKQLTIDIKADKAFYLPREAVNLNIKVADERGIPLAGKFSLSVADESLLTFADDKQGNILANILLESELKGEIEEPNFYFEPKVKHPEKDQLMALDHLMLTQGWRRFDWGGVRGRALAEMKYKNEEAVIGGMVVDEYGKPIEGAGVRIVGSDFETETDSNGNFRLENFNIENRNYELEVKSANLKRVINLESYNTGHLLKLYGSNFRKKKKPIVSEITYVEAEQSSATQTWIKGIIRDEALGDELIGANIVLKKDGQSSNIGTISNIDGEFSFNAPAGVCQIVVSYVGYKSKIIEVNVLENHINDLKTINLVGAVHLNEVVVVGKGKKVSKFSKAYSSSVVKSDEIKKLKKKKIESLANTAAKSSQGNNRQGVTVRGARSNATDYYIDGVRVSGSLIPESALQRMEREGLLTGTPANQSGFEPEKELADVVIVEKPKVAKRKQQRQRQAKALPRPKSHVYHQPDAFYSPRYTPKAAETKPDFRNDFRSTLYWNPAVETGMDGTATVSFFTSDALTSFRAVVEGFGINGSIGSGVQNITTKVPFSMDVKLPAQVLMGDEMKIPVIFNNTQARQVTGKIDLQLPDGLELAKGFSANVTIKPHVGKTVYVPVKATKPMPTTQVRLSFNSADYKDAMIGKVEVLAKGFPVSKGYTSRELSHEFTLNLQEPVANSVQLKLTAQTSPEQEVLADMKRMLRQPRGCFEQVSSSNYPNLLVMDYLETVGELDRDTRSQLLGYLKAGYKKLTGYEVKQGGFDWFGKPPGHEALTAYGLLQFTDMSRVFDVDEKMIKRNARWLLGRRNGEGGWQCSKRGAHRWARQTAAYDAYITWALTEAGMAKDLSKEMAFNTEKALAAKDDYLLALMANSSNIVKYEKEKELFEVLVRQQSENGSWQNAETTVTHSSGQSKILETTALAALALLKSDDYPDALAKAMDFLQNQKSKYGYGSTQATVLVLKAKLEYAKRKPAQPESGRLAVLINNKQVATKKYDAKDKSNIVIDGLAEYLVEGANKVQIRFDQTEQALPYYLAFNYNTLLPENDDCALSLSTTIADQHPKMGETVRLSIDLQNTRQEAVANPIARIGIPAGLSLPIWQLKELSEQKVFDYYEIFEGDLVLYFRTFDGQEKRRVHLDLKAEVPGSYEAAASSAWLYYEGERVTWSRVRGVEVW